jgi:formate--tetrahydrofolate ligase
VIVATVRALKFHGGVEVGTLGREDLDALARGMVNLHRHADTLRDVFGLRCVVAINHFAADTAAELEWLARALAQRGLPAAVARHWAEGSAGAEALARLVVAEADARPPSSLRMAYADDDALWDKMRAIARRVYGATDVSGSPAVRARVRQLQQQGYGGLPVCVAKTQYSFSTDASRRGAPDGHVVDVREVRLAAGAGFVVMICGGVMTMPGLPREPAAHRIDVGDDGRITGLF